MPVNTSYFFARELLVTAAIAVVTKFVGQIVQVYAVPSLIYLMYLIMGNIS